MISPKIQCALGLSVVGVILVFTASIMLMFEPDDFTGSLSNTRSVHFHGSNFADVASGMDVSTYTALTPRLKHNYASVQNDKITAPREWNSLFSSKPYDEQHFTDDARAFNAYPILRGYPEVSNHPETFPRMYINGDFSMSFLTSISSTVYLQILLFIYFLSFVDAMLHMYRYYRTEQKQAALANAKGTEEDIPKETLSYADKLIGDYKLQDVWLAVVTFLVLVIWWRKMLMYEAEVKWSQLTVDYFSSDTTPSLVFTSLLYVLYGIHLYTKNGKLHNVFGTSATEYSECSGKEEFAEVDAEADNEFGWLAGTKTDGPASNGASIIFAVTLLLGGQALVGMSRRVVLETEVQLLLTCAVCISVLEILSHKVTSFFWYINHNFLTDTPENTTHAMLLCRWMAFMQLLVLTFQSFFLVVYTKLMYELVWTEWTTGSDAQSFFVAFLLAVSSYLFIRLMQLILTIWFAFNASEQNALNTLSPKMKSSMELMTFHSFLVMILLTTLVIYIRFAPDDNLKTLWSAEATPVVAMHSATANAQCAGGLQQNKFLYDHVFKTCTKDLHDDQNDILNAVTMKIHAWTRWTRLSSKSNKCTDSKCQGVELMFCSNGFEQQFGQCAAEYTRAQYRIPGGWTDDATKAMTLAA